MKVHESHTVVRVGFLEECRTCHACNCHGLPVLAVACKRTFEVEPEPPAHILLAIKQQAKRYGDQVRLLEDADHKEGRATVRRAWRTFLNQFHSESLIARAARESYYTAYCQ